MPYRIGVTERLTVRSCLRPAVLFLCLALASAPWSPVAVAASSPASGRMTAKPNLSAQAYVLLDQDSGRVMWSHRAYDRREPASLTKVMTALVALEEASIEKTLTVSTRAVGVGGALAGLNSGQKLELWVGLYGLLFLSGNDAARAIAENLGGSESGFAAMMNARARAIGANDTSFVNPHGLPDRGHHSTAYDLALITREALRNQTLARIVGRTTRTLPWRGGSRSMNNINKFMYRYSGATGVKTGYTAGAGYCLAAAAVRDGHRLVAILLGAPSSEARWQDATRIMDFGFANYASLLKTAQTRPATGDWPVPGGSTGTAAPARGTFLYRVREGDTLWSLSKRTGVGVAQIQRLNPGLDPDHIKAGQQLCLPR